MSIFLIPLEIGCSKLGEFLLKETTYLIVPYIIFFRQRASIRDFVGPFVRGSVGPRKTLIVLIGFQTANKNHLKSQEVAVRVTM